MQKQKKKLSLRNPLHLLRKLSLTLWVWELLSLFLSMSCFAAILILLARYDNKPLPKWKYGLTINGVISFLAGIVRAALVLPVAEAISQLKWHRFWDHQRPIMDFQRLDEASRGPWGCLMLFCHAKGLNLARVGGLITLAALVVEPFIQLIPSYPIRIEDSNTALLARNTYFKDFVAFSNRAGISGLESEAPGTQSADEYVLQSEEQTIKSFNEGLFGLKKNADYLLTPVCHTGNCTWPVFSSLALCSSCANLTSELQWESARNSSGWYLGENQIGPRLSLSSFQLARSTPSTDYSSAHLTIADFYYSSFDTLPTSNSTPWHLLRPAAYKCMLYVCVKTYNATKNNGVYTELVLSAWPTQADLSAKPLAKGMQDYFRSQDVSSAYYTIKAPNGEEVYKVSNTAYVILQGLLSRITKRLQYYAEQQGNDLSLTFWEAQRPGLSVGPAPVLSHIADVMTASLRNAGDPAESVVGKTHHLRTFLKARWWFAALPVALFALTSAFLLSTIVLTVRHQVPIWKSSSLAVLAHGLDEDTRDRIASSKLDVIEDHVEDYTMAMTVNEPRRRLKGMRW